MVKIKKEFIISLFIIILFCGILLLQAWHGKTSRIYSKYVHIEAIPESHYAYQVWERSGIQGRVLFLFDRHLNAKALNDSEEHQLSKENYVTFAIIGKRVRKIYHIIPDDSWELIKGRLLKKSIAEYNKNIFRYYLPDNGVPVYITRLADIGPMEEKVLLHINSDYWDEKDMRAIYRLLREGILKSDIITVSGEKSENYVNEIKGLTDKAL